MKIEDIIKIVKETDKIFFDDTLRNDVTEKGDSDFVTRADVEISKYLHRRLKEEFPEVGFISEEEEVSSDNNAYWILDPIDGTTNFMHQVGLSAVSLGLYKDGEITAGVIYNPHAKELFWAEKGCGAFLNGKRIYCTKTEKLSDCLGIFEYNPYFKEEYQEAFEQAYKVYTTCQDIRTFGSAAIELAYVACGRADVFLGRYLKPWDYAAAAVIIKEAGGVVSDLDGKLPIKELNKHIVGTNAAVYEAFVNLINN